MQAVSQSMELPALQFPNEEDSSGEKACGSGQTTTARKEYKYNKKINIKNINDDNNQFHIKDKRR